MPNQTHPAKSCQVVPACFLDREYQSGIHPKEQSPKQSTRYQKLSFELRNSSDDKFWLSPCPYLLSIIWNRRMIWGKGASARMVGKEGIGIETAKYDVLLFGRA
jgi:hypothetical protein